MNTKTRKVNERPRRPGVPPTAGIIVEGDAEFAALPLLHKKGLVGACPPLKAINLQGVGSHLEPIGIAKMVRPKVVEHQVADRKPIVICIDREQRPTTAASLAVSVMTELRKLLEEEGRSADGVHVAIADRAFEAWILADARGLHEQKLFVKAPKFHSFEGSLGREQKKGVVEIEDLLGRSYGKTTDGPRLFQKLRFEEARKHGTGQHGSRSLHGFLAALGV